MLSRASQTSLVCLRCHTRLSRQYQSWQLPRILLNLPCGRRWQGTVVVKGDDSDEAVHKHDSTSPEQQTQYPPVEPGLDGGNASSNKRKRVQQPKTFRRWRPPQSHELGVNVLGKPAEVLVVPTRDRSVMQPVSEEVDGRQTGAIQESLDSELRPVSMTDVLHYISDLKDELGKGSDTFSATDWQDSIKRLSSGFTKLQLQEYLRGAIGNVNPSQNEAHAPKPHAKHDLALRIMKDVWKWNCRDDKDAMPVDIINVTKKYVAVNAIKLEYIMSYEKQQLRQISETCEVQVDVFRKKNRIQLSGSEKPVANADAQLSLVVKGVKESFLRIPRFVKDNLGSDSELQSLVTFLMQKHRLTIKREQDVLRVIGLATTDANVVLRDIVLSLGKHKQRTPFSYCTQTDPRATTQIPMYTNSLPQPSDRSGGWYRHILTETYTDSRPPTTTRKAHKAEEFTDAGDTIELRRLTAHMIKSEKPDQKRLSHFGITRKDLSYEYTIDLGQALLRTETQNKPTITSAEHTHTAEIMFGSQMALLPQVLATGDFVALDRSDNTGETPSNKSVRPFLLHLRLRPFTESPRSPPIEVVLRGEDARLGLHQQLQIKKVCAIFDEWQHVVLLPHRSLDILMKRRSTINLLGDAGSEPKKAYMKILRQLGSHLEEAQSSDQARLPPIWRINFPPLSGKRESIAKSPTESQSAAQADNQDVASEHTIQVETSANTHVFTYILEPPEFLDVVPYQSPVLAGACIDHVYCETDTTEQPRQRQILRVASKSLSDLLYENPTKAELEDTTAIVRKHQPRQSVNAAYRLIEMLDNAQKMP